MADHHHNWIVRIIWDEYERIYDEINSTESVSSAAEFEYYLFNILLRVIINQVTASSDYDERKSKIIKSDKRGPLFKVCVSVNDY